MTNRLFKTKNIIIIMLAMLLCFLCACAKSEGASGHTLKKTGSMQLSYATQFTVDYYEGGYSHIHVADGSDYILVPEGKESNDLGIQGAVMIQCPVKDIYLAASSAMDFFVRLDLMNYLGSCSTKAEDYSIPKAREQIENGSILYIGKYSMPDFEMLLNTDCNLAIESTMITHSPETKEAIEALGIPVFTERSSYEAHPLGRLEWIKIYGLLTGHEAEASAFFEEKVAQLGELSASIEETPENENKPVVVFFYVSSNGYVNVRKPGDYISEMIRMAGGSPCEFPVPEGYDNALSNMNINWEDFYLIAKDADILVYDATIDRGISSVDELIDKNELFSDFKAVKNDRVYCTGMNMFQKSSAVADVIMDLNKILSKPQDELTYFYRIR